MASERRGGEAGADDVARLASRHPLIDHSFDLGPAGMT